MKNYLNKVRKLWLLILVQTNNYFVLYPHYIAYFIYQIVT